MKVNKLLIIGGHPTPALAVIDELRRKYSQIQIDFVGRRFVNNHERNDSFEYKEIQDRSIQFIPFTSGRGVLGIVQLPFTILKAIKILHKLKSDAILSFGGYISVPICIAGYLLHIPYFLHEQTAIPGYANIRLSAFARRIMVSFPQTIKYFDSSKTIVTGNPLRRTLFEAVSKTKTAKIRKPVIFVNGGNLGSHSINIHIFNILNELLEKYTVIHQVGNIQEYGDWDKAQDIRINLPKKLFTRYIPLQHLSTADMAKAYSESDMTVSRSGANTITELIALRKPAVLIPLPWSARGEQQAHAKLLASAHATITFNQNELSKSLLVCIQKVIDNVQSYTDNYDTLQHIYVPEASTRIIQTILKS